MPFVARVFRLPKDVGHPEEYQDAYAVEPEAGVAAVADGVASAIFSRQWAEILVTAALADPPDPADAETFAAWLAERRTAWSESIDVTGLAWFQKAKLPLGAFSTLLLVRTAPLEEDRPGEFGAYRLLAHAIGDSCLFQVRRGELVRMFPIETAEQFEADPVVLGSVDLSRDQLQQFVALDETCYEDDVLVLASDAVAEWAVRQIEAGTPPDWDRYWHLTHAQWEEEVAALRHERQMRYDDATMLLVRLAPEGTMLEEPEEPLEPAASVDLAATGAAEPQGGVEPNAAAPQPGQSPGEEPSSGELAAHGTDEEDEDWKGKFKEASRNFAEGVEQASSQLMRGLRRWTDKARQKYRDKFGRREDKK